MSDLEWIPFKRRRRSKIVSKSHLGCSENGKDPAHHQWIRRIRRKKHQESRNPSKSHCWEKCDWYPQSFLCRKFGSGRYNLKIQIISNFFCSFTNDHVFLSVVYTSVVQLRVVCGPRNNFAQVLSITSSGNLFFWRTLWFWDENRYFGDRFQLKTFFFF